MGVLKQAPYQALAVFSLLFGLIYLQTWRLCRLENPGYTTGYDRVVFRPLLFGCAGVNLLILGIVIKTHV